MNNCLSRKDIAEQNLSTALFVENEPLAPMAAAERRQ